jgi:hypothetical protein
MMSFLTLLGVVAAAALLAGMLLFMELGRRIGLGELARHPDAARAGVGVVEGAVFALLALLMGFSFAAAASRFDERRQLIGREAVAIGTAWLRIDLLPDESQPAIRDGFRHYLDARLAAYRALPDDEAWEAQLAVAARAQHDIWTRTVAAASGPGGDRARVLIIPSLNEMFALAQTRILARRAHPPAAIYVLLVVAALVAALFAGYTMANGQTRNWAYMLGFAATTALTVYVIIEIEFPRVGFVRVDSYDRGLVEVRASMR